MKQSTHVVTSNEKSRCVVTSSETI